MSISIDPGEESAKSNASGWMRTVAGNSLLLGCLNKNIITSTERTNSKDWLPGLDDVDNKYN
ncbi:MAG: hypothetical protein L6305_03050 [Actinomycetia bacterium]|nr:hypothetical protein [Actinomycetes bacterium]